MRGKRVLLTVALAVFVFAALFAAVSAGFKAEHLHWPAWLTASVGAALALAAGLSKKPLETLSGWLARPLERSQHRNDALASIMGYGVRVKQVTSRLALNIHPAIPLPDGADSTLSNEFPEYVPRDVDPGVRTWIRGHLADGAMLVVVGSATAGKTRCLYEALRAEIPNWWMLQPDNGLRINELVQAKVPLHQSVLWLNELQTFFAGDPLTAATVRQLLAGRCGPVLLAGTIRSEEIDRLIGRGDGDGKEINREAREILDMLARHSNRSLGSDRAVRFDLPNRFSENELDRAEMLARRDPRLMVAIRDADESNVTATLAGADELVGHWLADGSDISGRTIINAAVAARLCGHPDPVPVGILETLALRLLAAAGAAPASTDWLDAALAWAEAPIKGRISAIRPVRTRVGPIDGYKVSDILVQHCHDHDVPEINQTLAADAAWHLLIGQAATSIGVEIGITAMFSDRLAIAEHAFRVAADQGEARAMNNLGFLLSTLGRDEEAMEWHLKGANLGYPPAMNSLGYILTRKEESVTLGIQWYRRAAALGYATAMMNLGFELQGREELADAEKWYRKAADLGSAYAMSNLGFLRRRAGQLDDAEEWFRKAADLGFSGAMSNLAGLLRDRGDVDSALKWFQKSAERAYADVIGNPYHWRPWPGEAGDGGVSESILGLANLLAVRGGHVEAEMWYRRGADLGDARSASGLAALLEARGDTTDADGWRRKAADLAYANLLRNRRSLMTAYGEAAVLRHTATIREVAVRTEATGDLGQAEHWYRLAAEQGDAPAMHQLGSLLKDQGRTADADEWLRKAAEQGFVEPAADDDPNEG